MSKTLLFYLIVANAFEYLTNVIFIIFFFSFLCYLTTKAKIVLNFNLDFKSAKKKLVDLMFVFSSENKDFLVYFVPYKL